MKRETGIESSGLLAFHLGKLAGLVKLNPEGAYALTDEGREALRMVEASGKQVREGRPGRRLAVRVPHQKALVAGLVVALVVLGSVALYQQEQISSLDGQVRAGTALVDGVRYWDMALPVTVPNGTTIAFHGVTFAATTSPTSSFQYSYPDPGNYVFSGSVRLSNDTLLNLTGRSVEITYHFTIPHFMIQNDTLPPYPFQPAVVVSFADGAKEFYNGYTIAASNVPASQNIPYEHVLLNVTDNPTEVNPWFTQHTGPRAGVLWNSTSNELQFLVSTD